MGWFFDRNIDASDINTVVDKMKDERKDKPKIISDIDYIANLHEATQECVINARDFIIDKIDGGKDYLAIVNSFVDGVDKNLESFIEHLKKQNETLNNLVDSSNGLGVIWNEKFIGQFIKQSETINRQGDILKDLQNSVDQLNTKLGTTQKVIDIIDGEVNKLDDEDDEDYRYDQDDEDDHNIVKIIIKDQVYVISISVYFYSKLGHTVTSGDYDKINKAVEKVVDTIYVLTPNVYSHEAEKQIFDTLSKKDLPVEFSKVEVNKGHSISTNINKNFSFGYAWIDNK